MSFKYLCTKVTVKRNPCTKLAVKSIMKKDQREKTPFNADECLKSSSSFICLLTFKLKSEESLRRHQYLINSSKCKTFILDN